MIDSERKPRRQDRWDKVHLRTVSTHLREEEDALFRVACSLERTTRYAVMQALARGWLESCWTENGGGSPSARPAPSHCTTGRKGRDERA